ncbi:MAG: hypothetical protein GY832_45930 [Chloroflexi bacterium]|nr:hypothetical protein [Chloroflexota bacterium]
MKMFDRLPIKRNLTLSYVLSLVVALIMTVSSVAGLLYQTRIYSTDEVIVSFVPLDVLNLAIGLPILLGSMWLARRGKLIGLLCWPGVLLYVLYSYVNYLIGVPFGVLFLLYVLLVVLVVYTIIGLVASIDGEAVRQRIDGIVPARAAGGILFVLTSLFIVINIADIVAALTSQATIGPLKVMIWIADFTTIVPACLVGGFLLWRREALGYVAGAGLFLLYSMLFIGLVPIMMFQARYSALPVDVVGIVMMLLMGMICFIPFGLFVRGIARS